MNKKIALSAVCLMAACSAFSQKIYSTDREYQADIKVYVVDSEYRADKKVYLVDSEYQADIFDEVDAQSCPIILDFNLPEYTVSNKEAVEDTSSSYPDTISVQEAAHWMARLAACDGAISPTGRKILSQFAKNFGLDNDFFTN